MTTDKDSLNAPRAGSSYNPIVWPVIKATLANGDRQIIYIQPMVNFHPIAIALTDNTKITTEGTCSSPADIKAGTANWFAVTTSAAYTTLAGPMTALRFTATGACTIEVIP